jgi:hypothetical protein
VALLVRAGREEERPGRPRVATVAEAERPPPVDRERLAVRTAQLAAVGELSVRELLVGVDLPVAEVAEEQVTAEARGVQKLGSRFERWGLAGDSIASCGAPKLGPACKFVVSGSAG